MRATNKRILIVDPDAKAAQVMSSLFIDKGCDVEISGGIRETAERIKDVKFDCIIMDVALPEMKGYEGVSILKAIDPKVQIIMTAAENTMELELKVRKEDIFYYYIKSFDHQELKEAVGNIFKKLERIEKMGKISEPQRILVVDDDPCFVAAMITILESKGYEVEPAYDSEEAMEKIITLKPNLIIMDIMMEKLTSGFDLCYKLKQDNELKKIPVLVASSVHNRFWFSYSPNADGECCGADDFVEKPIVEPDNFLWRVNRLLGRYSKSS